MSNDTDSFVQEVDQNLREEKLMAALKRYGPWAGAALIVILIAAFGWVQWRGYQQNASREHAQTYAAAQALMASGNLDAAKAEFERLHGEGPQIYRVMAQMEHAAVLEAQGDLEAALNGFDAAARAARDPVMRETAQLRAAYLAAETQDFEALQVRLQPLIGSDSRLSFLARELLAIEAWEAGDANLARATLESLTLAFDAPESVRERAQVALSVIGAAPTESTAGAAQAPAPAEGESK